MIGVFDIFCTMRYTSYIPENSLDAVLASQQDLLPYLVKPSGDTNKLPYAIGGGHMDFDDLLYVDESLSVKLCRDHVRHISEYLNDCKRNRVDIRDWFRSQMNYIEQNDETIPERVIIPVPENMDVDQQSALISTVEGTKCTLLWRSIAAFLGQENALFELGFGTKTDDYVLIIDCNSISITATKIYCDKCNDRLIPAHRLYLREDCKTDRDIKNYPYEKERNIIYNPLDPYIINSAGMLEKHVDTHCYEAVNRLEIPQDCRYAIVIGDLANCNVILDSGYHRVNIIQDKDGSSVLYGAAKFANRMAHKIVSYYDECEELSIVLQTKAETVLFKTLIPASTRLTGGLEIIGHPVDGIQIRKGMDCVEFYLRIGPQDKSKPLRVFKQQFKQPDGSLFISAEDIPLELHPTLIAGQGRAHVLIEPVNNSEGFHSVELDWENMSIAKDERDVPVTVNYIEMHMERSFPVDMPPVEAKHMSHYDSIWYREVVDGHCGFYPQNNIPRWLCPNADNLDRFRKENVFGMEAGENEGFPAQYKDIISKTFTLLDSRYADYGGIDSNLFHVIAWSYHPSYFPKTMRLFEEYLNKRRKNGIAKLKAVEASFCANMMTNGKYAASFMTAFCNAVQINNSPGNWYRAAYQILMYSLDALSSMEDKSQDFYKLICKSICNADMYASTRKALNSPALDNVIKFLLFSLKYRIIKSTFARESGNIADSSIYYILNYISSDAVDTIAPFVRRSIELAASSSSGSPIYNMYRYIWVGIKDGSRSLEYERMKNILNVEVLPGQMIDSLDDIPEAADLIKLAARHRWVYKKSKWKRYLNEYLNGAGLLNLPVADLG